MSESPTREPKAPASPGLRSEERATREGDASRGAGGEWENTVAETTARSAEKYRVTRSRRNVAWTGLGALVVVVVLALFPYLVGAGTETILVQAFIILTLASMWNLLAGYIVFLAVLVLRPQGLIARRAQS